MRIGIIRNNSLVGGRARAEAWTSATERVTLYCTWRLSALTTRPHGQVWHVPLSPNNIHWSDTVHLLMSVISEGVHLFTFIISEGHDTGLYPLYQRWQVFTWLLASTGSLLWDVWLLSCVYVVVMVPSTESWHEERRLPSFRSLNVWMNEKIMGQWRFYPVGVIALSLSFFSALTLLQVSSK